MSGARWNEDGVTPWRSPGPRPVVDLFVAKSSDYSVADTIALSGSLPVSAYFREPEGTRSQPFILVEPRGAVGTSPATTVNVSLRDASGSVIDQREVPWDPGDYDKRVGLGDAIRALSKRPEVVHRAR